MKCAPDLRRRFPLGQSLLTVTLMAGVWLAVVMTSPLAANTGTIFAQPRWSHFADLIFRHYTPETGLPFTGATAIAQDRQGFLWVGSQSGLARWDGERFRVYRAGDRRSGLRDDLIKVMQVDTRGRVWVGMNAGGMAAYDAESDRFVAYGAGSRGLSHPGVRAIEDDGRGALWVATFGGLDHVDPEANTVRRYHHIAADPRSLPANHVSALLLGKNGGLWVGTAAGLSFLDPMTGRFHRLIIPGHSAVKQPAVTSLVKDSLGQMWIGTVGAGAFRYDPTTASIAPVQEKEDRNFSLAHQTITSIVQAGSGEVWIGTAGNGIVIVELATGETRRVVHDARVPSSLADDAPVSLFSDHNGRIWVGTQSALSRYDPTRTGLWTLLGGTQRPGTLSNPDVTGVLASADGRIWLGLGSGGVAIVDPARGTIDALSGRVPAMSRLPAISAFAELPGRQVLIGTNAGLFEIDQAASRLAPFGFRGARATHAVTALLFDGQALWIGRLDGVWRIDAGPAKSHLPSRVTESDRLTDQRVMSIARGSDGALWIGTQNGLNRVVPRSGVAERVPLDRSGADGLVPTVLTDKRGRIWAGVYGHGLAIIEHPRAGGWSIRYIGVSQGLPDSNVNKLLEDGDGNIWASTDNGLAVIDPSRFSVRALKQPDAVAIAAYWNGSGAKTLAGQLVFGGVGGVTIVDPRRVAPPLTRPPLVLTELRLGGKEVAVGPYNDPSLNRTATIRSSANSLFAEFASLDYADFASARYAYRLRGYQTEWNTADAAHRSASYTNLPPGRYVLELRSLPVHAGRRQAGLELSIDVLPAWYQTLWFKLGLATLAAALVMAIIQLRTAVLRRRQRELEQLVADRTATLRKTQRELEQIAYIDVLTGLPNRRMFNEQLRACLERSDKKGNSAALLLIDLDHFKTINDTHGHDAGDALLAEVAIRWQDVIREHDTLARLGGDEFAILVSDAGDARRIEHICWNIIGSLAEPVSFQGAQIRSGASIGIATYTPRAMTSSELYKASDLALYAAKKQGRGSWVWYGENLPSGEVDANSSLARRGLR